MPVVEVFRYDVEDVLFLWMSTEDFLASLWSLFAFKDFLAERADCVRAAAERVKGPIGVRQVGASARACDRRGQGPIGDLTAELTSHQSDLSGRDE